MKNTFGTGIQLTLFGESHGESIGAVLDGLTPGIPVDEQEISRQLSRYGATNTLEWFAESFAEGMRSENPRPMAREFMLELDKILRRLR